MEKRRKENIKELELTRLPSLPKLPSFPNFPTSEKENSFSINSLPSFPSSEFGGKMEKNAIKNSILPSISEIPDSQFEDETSLDYPQDYKYALSNLEKAKEIEKEEEELGLPPPKISRLIPKQESMQEQMNEIKGKQVFVKLDNYKQGLEAVQEMKAKLEEIEGVIAEINEAREREESELHKWQDEASSLRMKLDIIEKSLFSRT